MIRYEGLEFGLWYTSDIFPGDAIVHSWVGDRKEISIYNSHGEIIENHPSPHVCKSSLNSPKEHVSNWQ